MSDAIKIAAARIKEDALNLAERARREAASAFASVNENRDELRAKATETAKLAGEVIAENARIATDLARRNASAAATMISDNARTLSDEMGPLREQAELFAQDASERLSNAARELSDKVSQNSKYASEQARAHPGIVVGLAAGGLAMLVTAFALLRKPKAEEPAPVPADNTLVRDPGAPTGAAAPTGPVPAKPRK